MHIRTSLTAALSALALSACATGPGSVASTVAAPAATGPFLSAADGVVTANPLPQDWWRLYRDPVLDTLVADALAANTDVRQAAARIDRARAALRGARADRLPQTAIAASGGYARLPEGQVAPGADRSDTSYSLGADVSYELDLFGRVRSGIAAAGGDLAAARADADAVRVMVTVARAALYPRITLGGSASATASSLGNLFTGGPLGFFLGSLIDWAFPNSEPVRARIDAAGADAAQSLAAFDGTILTALQETETALSGYASGLAQRRALATARAAALRAATIVRAQNREGVVDSLQTLDAERTLAEAEAALADQDALVSRSQIALFRALGGGWAVTDPGTAE